MEEGNKNELGRDRVPFVKNFRLGFHNLQIPASFANQFYSLRSHVAMVRARLMSDAL